MKPKHPRDNITRSRLLEVLDYNPQTGYFTWKKKTAFCTKLGSIAGNLEAGGYISICIDTIRNKAHRLAWLYMTGEWPSDQLDHINHNRSDNRWCNLREATIRTNGQNRSIGTNNKSSVVGVSWNKKERKWWAAICVNKKRIFLGIFDNFDDAVAARESANRKYRFHENHGV